MHEEPAASRMSHSITSNTYNRKAKPLPDLGENNVRIRIEPPGCAKPCVRKRFGPLGPETAPSGLGGFGTRKALSGPKSPPDLKHGVGALNHEKPLVDKWRWCAFYLS
jgi:hypothetical protein